MSTNDQAEETQTETSEDAEGANVDTFDAATAAQNDGTAAAAPAAGEKQPSNISAVNQDYIMWLGTVATSALAGLCLLLLAVSYLMNAVGSFSDLGSIFDGGYTKLFQASLLFAGMAVVIHLDTSKYRLILVFGGWGRLARALAVPSVH